jgi:hypothetical protein
MEHASKFQFKPPFETEKKIFLQAKKAGKSNQKRVRLQKTLFNKGINASVGIETGSWLGKQVKADGYVAGIGGIHRRELCTDFRPGDAFHNGSLSNPGPIPVVQMKLQPDLISGFEHDLPDGLKSHPLTRQIHDGGFTGKAVFFRNIGARQMGLDECTIKVRVFSMGFPSIKHGNVCIFTPAADPELDFLFSVKIFGGINRLCPVAFRADQCGCIILADVKFDLHGNDPSQSPFQFQFMKESEAYAAFRFSPWSFKSQKPLRNQ